MQQLLFLYSNIHQRLYIVCVKKVYFVKVFPGQWTHKWHGARLTAAPHVMLGDSIEYFFPGQTEGPCLGTDNRVVGRGG